MRARVHLPVILLLLTTACVGYANTGEYASQRKLSALCGGGLNEVGRRVLSAHGLPHVSSYFPVGEGLTQEEALSGTVCAVDALALAIDALEQDKGAQSITSLLSDRCTDDCSVRAVLNQPGVLLGIVGALSRGQELMPEPPRPRRIERDWIFFVSAPALSEHGHWVFVSRMSGQTEVLSEN